MRRPKILRGADRHDGRWIDLGMGHIVVTLDVIEVDRLGDAAQLAFEVADVHRIKTDERYEQTPVRLERRGSEEITPAAQPIIEHVEREGAVVVTTAS